ncbi:MAG: PKD domain-containing protein [Planctomycetota bacterium]
MPATTSETTFEVQWAGQDEPGGSGIAYYDVCVSVDDGPYELLQDDTTDTSTTFTGELGHTYAFYSVATDNVGHQEAPPEVADATITIVPPLQIEAGLDQSGVEGDLVDLVDAYYVYPGDPADLSLTIDWGDGTIEPGKLVPGNGGGTIANTHAYADNAAIPYVVTLTLSDNTGTTVEDDLAVTVSNAIPIIDPTPDQETDEGAAFDLSVTFSDPGSADTHTGTIDWGDGTSETIDPATRLITGSHVYADNGVYPVTVRVWDDDMAGPSGGGVVGVDFAEAAFTVTVLNVAPTITGSSGPDPSPAVRGQTLSFSGTFNDSGTADTHTARIEWGDGAVSDPVPVTESPFGPPGSVDGADGSFAASHVYAAEGTYTVTVTVSDDEGDLATEAYPVTVGVVAMQEDHCAGGMLLAVGGSLDGDHIAFHPGDGPQDIVVTMNDVSYGPYQPDWRLLAFGQDGDDNIQVAGSIALSAWLYGDAGDDRLKGGGGPDMLHGGLGNDLLVGQSGRDVLIGGRGADRMVGNAADDIMIGGYLGFADLDEALCAIMREWTSTREPGYRRANLEGDDSNPEWDNRLNDAIFLTTQGDNRTVFHDDAEDLLTGSAGLDWFLASLVDDDDGTRDKVTDLHDNEFAVDLDWILSP